MIWIIAYNSVYVKHTEKQIKQKKSVSLGNIRK